MQCYECKKAGRSEEAVALCSTCSVGLCMKHLQETADFVAGMTWWSCPHNPRQRSRGGAAAGR